MVRVAVCGAALGNLNKNVELFHSELTGSGCLARLMREIPFDCWGRWSVLPEWAGLVLQLGIAPRLSIRMKLKVIAYHRLDVRTF